jgi:hypothetical protein
MREYEAQRQAKLLQGSALPDTETPDPVIHSMGLKPRKPSIRQLIGDQNPLTQEEYEALGQLFKFGRIQE